MPSSFFNRSPLNVVTPFKYSMGLDNMLDNELMELLFTNIQFRPRYRFSLAGERRKNTERFKRLSINLLTGTYRFALF